MTQAQIKAQTQEQAWESFFGPAYLVFSQFILTPERTKQEVAGIHQMLELEAGARILDLGCGQGRLTLPLAALGYRMVGFDGSGVSLQRAREQAASVGIQAEWVEGYMKDLVLEESVDAVINMGTAFGYVSEEDDRAALARVYEALKPGGKLLIETENRDYKIRNVKPRTWDDMGGQTIWSERRFDAMSGRWTETIRWFEPSGQQESVLDVRLYSASEFTWLLHEAGFEVLGVYGDLDRAAFSLEQSRMVLLAEKL